MRQKRGEQRANLAHRRYARFDVGRHAHGRNLMQAHEAVTRECKRKRGELTPKAYRPRKMITNMVSE